MSRNQNHPFWKSLVAGVIGVPSPVLSKIQADQKAAERDVSVGPFGGPGITLRDPIIPEPPKRPTGTRAVPTIQPLTGIADLQSANRDARAFFEGWRKVAEVFYDTQIIDFKQYTARITELDEGLRGAQVENARQVRAQLEAQLSTLTPGTENFKRVQDALSKVIEESAKLGNALGIQVLPEMQKFTESLRRLVLPLTKAPDLTQPANRPRTVTGVGVPHPEDGVVEGVPSTRARRVTVSARQQALQDQLGFVFEDFIFQIVSARQGVKEAFGGFMLGIVDTIAAEFARSVQESFAQHLIRPFADWLDNALTELFSGISGKGIGKFFGGLIKGIGSLFGGFFDNGGTLGAGKWGVVGESGPEIAFSGSRPMTIMPMGAMAGGGGVNITFHVTAPGGSLDRRSMDQMSEQVLRAVERGTRNRGV
jgi:hypothetical protein